MVGDGSGALESGVAIGAATILSFGPNNLMMLREGLLGWRIGRVAVAVWASYVVLLGAAAAAAGLSLAEPDRSIRVALVWSGAGILALLAIRSFLSGVRPPAATVDGEQRKLVRVLCVVWVNPLTHLELFVAPAMLGQAYPAAGRAAFFGGVLAMATACCCLYPCLGRAVARSWRRSPSPRVLNLASGMALAVAALLAIQPMLQ